MKRGFSGCGGEAQNRLTDLPRRDFFGGPAQRHEDPDRAKGRAKGSRANSLNWSGAMSDFSREALWGLPDVLPFESPASWISRAAQSVGVGIDEFLEHLKLDGAGDLDVQFLGEEFWRLTRLCGLKLNAFSEARRVMSSVEMLNRSGQRLLMTSAGRPRYRVCPRCVGAQRTAHFGLQCRFEAWRSCPTHRCMMEDGCWRCRALIVLPFSPGIDGPRRVDCTSLDQCRHCGARSRHGPVADITDAGRHFTKAEVLLLSNGASLMAALFQQRVEMPDNRVFPLSRLRDLHRMGLLARKGYGPTAALWRERAEALCTVSESEVGWARTESEEPLPG